MSVIETERTGKIQDFYDEDTGVILEDNTGREFDFAKRGAQVDMKKGDNVLFISIKTPSGREIVKQVIKK